MISAKADFIVEAENPVCLGVVRIVIQLLMNEKNNDEAGSNPHCQAEDVYQCIEPMLVQIPKGYGEVVSQHDVRGLKEQVNL